MKNEPEINQALLQANPLIAVLVFLFGMVVLLLLSSFFVLWIGMLMRWYRGIAVLTVEPWKPRSWGLVDVLLVLVAAFVGQAVLIPAWAKLSGTDLRKMVETDSISLAVMAVGSLSYVVAMVGGIGWLVLRYSASVKHMGLALRRMIPNTGLGLAAAAMTLPIVGLLNWAVSEGLKSEYDHPLINELKKEGTVTGYLLAVFCAVLVAPLVEEFFFRVLLQGWLQSVPWSAGGWWWLLGSSRPQSAALMSEADLANVSETNLVASAADSPTLPPQVLANPYQPPVVSSDLEASVHLGQSTDTIHIASNAKPPIWPSFVAGILFGFAHYDYGLSFIPLSVLGVVLGLLYRAKHSIWPCFVLHFALNSFAMASLGITLLVEAAK